MLNRILSMLAGSWALKKRFYADYGTTSYRERLEPVTSYLVTKQIADTKDALRKTYKHFDVTMSILSCVSSIEIIQWLTTTGQLESLLAKQRQITSIKPGKGAEYNLDDAAADDDDGEESPWMTYLADFVSGNAKKLRRDVFVSVSPFYVEQSRLANLNLFAEIPNDDDFSLIQYLIDSAVDDYVSMCVYANFAVAFNGVDTAQ